MLLGLFRIIACVIPSKRTREFVREIIPSKIYQKLFVRNVVFLSVGGSCISALHLKAHCLRQLSAPLDWMMNYSLLETYRLFQNDFTDFFTQCYKDENGYVVDCKSGMVSIHHFPKDKNIPHTQYLPEFWRIMQRRHQKIKSHIARSLCVVLVSCRNEDLEVLKDFAIKMHELLNHKSYRGQKTPRGGGGQKRVFLINIFHTPNSQSFQRQTYIINNTLQIIQYCFDNTNTKNKKHWLGNIQAWSSVMNEIQYLH